jgi:RIO kinase 1
LASTAAHHAALARSRASGESPLKRQWIDDIEDVAVDEQNNVPIDDAFATFYDRSLISDVLYEVKSGKEATVYCCRAHPETGAGLFAAKVYREREHRGFHNEAIYREGRPLLDKRAQRALEKGSTAGKRMQYASWIGFEWETLQHLHAAGADVPRPVAVAGSAILMQFFGDEDGVAQPLANVDLRPGEALPLFERIMRNVELFLAQNRVHADLSAYNILYHAGQPLVIDFPQAVDPRFNANARDLLLRDVRNVCRYFSRYGVRTDADAIVSRLWWRFRRSEL